MELAFGKRSRGLPSECVNRPASVFIILDMLDLAREFLAVSTFGRLGSSGKTASEATMDIVTRAHRLLDVCRPRPDNNSDRSVAGG